MTDNAKLHCKKMHKTVSFVYLRTQPKFIYFSGSQQVYFLHRN